jgi:predicted TIM-barrel fold metal-dependent hydrolase
MRFFPLLLLTLPLAAQQAMSIEEYDPKSTLVTPQHPKTRAKYPIIDVHNHQNRCQSQECLDKIIRDMDSINLRVMVQLSGGSGDRLKKGLEAQTKAYPGRFVWFANLDFNAHGGVDDSNWGKLAAEQLAADEKNGAKGLKIFKNFGMDLKDKNGKRVHVDDPRFDPVWDACAQLKIPVLIHTGEPWSFFQPHDKTNERWLELKQFPSRGRPADRYDSWETIMGEQHNLFARHPKTVFINAHLGWMGGNLDELGRLMDKMPNMYTEIGAVLAELGRQPRHAREWFIQHQDRVLFGKDIWEPTEYHYYFRVLETTDEYFDYYRKRHAFWKMYGLDLPDDVLKKLYYKNALRIIPGIDASGFPK